MNQETKKVVVIGSGIGGSAIAAMLTHRGFNVTVLEKLGFIGGRCCSREREGFILDLGVHTFSQAGEGPLGEVLRKCDRHDVIQWSYTRKPTQKLNYLGTTCDFPRGIDKIGVDIDLYMRIMADIVSMPWDEISKLDGVSVKDWLNKYTTDQAIHNIFCYITELYFVTRYWRASVGEFIRSMQVQAKKRASGYPIGGCRVIPQSYLDVVTDGGNEVRTNCAVKKIVIEEGRAAGVELNSGEFIAADIVIGNIDPFLMLKMTGEENFPSEYVTRIKNIEMGPGAYVLKIALKKKITDEKFLMLIGHPNGTELYTAVENEEIPDKVNLMVPVTSNMDPSTAPEGKQLIIAGFFPVYNRDWDGWRRALINSVKELFPDIEENILFLEDTHTEEVEKLVGEGGGVIGMAQTVDQVGKKRLSQKTPISNLFLVGGEAGGWGIGTELAANSALELNDIIE